MNANERESKSGAVAGRGGEIVLYRGKDGRTSLDVRLEQDTVWLDAHQMATLFGRDRTVIVRHIRNIYATNELAQTATCAKIAQVAADGKLRQMDIYNLDMIVSVGYLNANGILYRADGGKRLADNALVALTLLIAESKPAEMDIICKVIVNLINRENL